MRRENHQRREYQQIRKGISRLYEVLIYAFIFGEAYCIMGSATMLELTMSIGLLIFAGACLWLYFTNDETSTFKRNIRILIKLLQNMGYYPKQISKILDFYD
jgi:hypothetical protein